MAKKEKQSEKTSKPWDTEFMKLNQSIRSKFLRKEETQQTYEKLSTKITLGSLMKNVQVDKRYINLLFEISAWGKTDKI